MANRKDEMRKQAIELWKKTVAQLDQISKTLRATGIERFKAERDRLLSERDKLFKRLGEETYKLIEARKIKVPKGIQDIYVRIRNLMDVLIMQKKPKKKAAKKKITAAKKKAAKKKKKA
jgi:hypothetical protein